MLPIADQTDGPIGLNFCVDTQGWLGGVFSNIFKIHFKHFLKNVLHGERLAFS